MDGSVDKGKVENEVILVQYCHLDNEVKSCSRFLKIIEPKKADANGGGVPWQGITSDGCE